MEDMQPKMRIGKQKMARKAAVKGSHMQSLVDCDQGVFGRSLIEYDLRVLGDGEDGSELFYKWRKVRYIVGCQLDSLQRS